MAVKGAEPGGALALAAKLFDIGTVDTVYRDVYLRRARTVLSGVFPVEQFRGFEPQKADLAMLPLMIGRALDRRDWAQVKELSDRATTLRRAVEGKHRHGDGRDAVQDLTAADGAGDAGQRTTLRGSSHVLFRRHSAASAPTGSCRPAPRVAARAGGTARLRVESTLHG